MSKAIFELDINRCGGCFACSVACMDQNDSYDIANNNGNREVFYLDETPEKVGYISASCNHCDEPKCVEACPTGCLTKSKNGLVVTNNELCIGCHSCALGCPHGVPRFDENAKIKKCEGCLERVEAGFTPPCVRVCPAKALKFNI